jgi:hypothetical protein
LAEGDLNHEFSREKLKDTESKRIARERSEVLSLIERGVILLVTVASFAYALIDHANAPSFSALGGVALLARLRL